MDSYLGEIRAFPYSFIPEYWIFCDGRVLMISEFAALYSLLGTRFGGNGYTTFAVPDLQGAEGESGMHYAISAMGYYPPRP